MQVIGNTNLKSYIFETIAIANSIHTSILPINKMQCPMSNAGPKILNTVINYKQE